MDLSKMTVKEIKEIVKDLEKVEQNLIERLSLDSRQGVQKLAQQIVRKRHAEEKNRKKFTRMSKHESRLREEGYRLVCGIDEAGRGPLAGPVVAAAVILPADSYISGVDDSKKLSQKRREELYDIIKERALAVGIGIVDNKRIDEINILQATYQAMHQAIDSLKFPPDYLLIDAETLPRTNIPQIGIVEGDSNSVSIAAASIIAKVTRDRMLLEYHKKYPEYNFARHKGYGTQEHIQALEEYGVTDIHRRTFRIVSKLL